MELILVLVAIALYGAVAVVNRLSGQEKAHHRKRLEAAHGGPGID